MVTGNDDLGAIPDGSVRESYGEARPGAGIPGRSRPSPRPQGTWSAAQAATPTVSSVVTAGIAVIRCGIIQLE